MLDSAGAAPPAAAAHVSVPDSYKDGDDGRTGALLLSTYPLRCHDMLLLQIVCDGLFIFFLVSLLATRRLLAELVATHVFASSSSSEAEGDGWTRRPAFFAACGAFVINGLYTAGWMMYAPTRGGPGSLTILADLTLWVAMLTLLSSNAWFFWTLLQTTDRVAIARSAREFGLTAVLVVLGLFVWGWFRYVWFGVTAVPLAIEVAIGGWCLVWAGRLGGALSI